MSESESLPVFSLACRDAVLRNFEQFDLPYRVSAFLESYTFLRAFGQSRETILAEPKPLLPVDLQIQLADVLDRLLAEHNRVRSEVSRLLPNLRRADNRSSRVRNFRLSDSNVSGLGKAALLEMSELFDRSDQSRVRMVLESGWFAAQWRRAFRLAARS